MRNILVEKSFLPRSDMMMYVVLFCLNCVVVECCLMMIDVRRRVKDEQETTSYREAKHLYVTNGAVTSEF